MMPSCVFSHEVLAKIAIWFGLVGVSPCLFFFLSDLIFGLLELEYSFAKAPCDELGITDLHRNTAIKFPRDVKTNSTVFVISDNISLLKKN